MNANAIDYFTAPRRLVALARVRKVRTIPSLDDLRAILSAMPGATIIDRRSRAIFALILLTGIRDGALVSLRIKHINLAERELFQDAAQVNTKASKTMRTWFFPVGLDVAAIVVAWVHELEGLGFGPDDPLFPKARALTGGHTSAQAGLGRDFWTTANPVRKVFKAASGASGGDCVRPHDVRSSLAQHATRVCKSIDELLAWSANLGHARLSTTLFPYASLSDDQRRDLILKGWAPVPEPSDGLSRLRSELRARLPDPTDQRALVDLVMSLLVDEPNARSQGRIPLPAVAM